MTKLRFAGWKTRSNKKHRGSIALCIKLCGGQHELIHGKTFWGTNSGMRINFNNHKTTRPVELGRD